MGTTVSDVLERAESGRVLTVFCPDVELARRQLRAAAEEQASVPTLVALEWERAPALDRELDEIRDALAQAAAELWPNWYITAEQRFERTRTPEADLSELVSEGTASSASPSASWLREAWRRCRDGKLPLVEHVTAAEQVRQLSRALDPGRLVFALSVVDGNAPSARMQGLARAAEWLAHESQAKALLLLPAHWQANRELDHVAYGAVALLPDTEPASAPSASGTPNSSAGPSKTRVAPPMRFMSSSGRLLASRTRGVRSSSCFTLG